MGQPSARPSLYMLEAAEGRGTRVIAIKFVGSRGWRPLGGASSPVLARLRRRIDIGRCQAGPYEKRAVMRRDRGDASEAHIYDAFASRRIARSLCVELLGLGAYVFFDSIVANGRSASISIALLEMERIPYLTLPKIVIPYLTLEKFFFPT
jgi:hypothetical protein